MDLSVVLFTSARGITPADAARAAEDAGFHAFYVPEHSHIPTSRDSAHPGTGGELPDDRYLRILDPWVALSTAAAVTSTIRLGTAVALPTEHDPITLAKTLATLDHLSGGRVNLGVGFGWNVEELEGHGVPGKKRAGAAEYRADAAAVDEEVARTTASSRSSSQRAWPSRCSGSDLSGRRYAENFDWIVANADGWITTPIETDIEDRVAGQSMGSSRTRGRSPDRRTPDQSARARPAGTLGRGRRRRGALRATRQGA